jgi:hypothetical protein
MAQKSRIGQQQSTELADRVQYDAATTVIAAAAMESASRIASTPSPMDEDAKTGTMKDSP